MATTTTAHSLGTVTLHAAAHPDPQINRLGFPLGHRYIETCWVSVLGPTGTMLLRRIADLWTQDLSPTVAVGDLASMVGVGRGTGRQSPLWRTVTRLERFRIVSAVGPGELEVYTELPPLRPCDLNRVSAWTRDQHDQLVDAHLTALNPA